MWCIIGTCTHAHEGTSRPRVPTCAKKRKECDEPWTGIENVGGSSEVSSPLSRRKNVEARCTLYHNYFKLHFFLFISFRAELS